MMKSKMSLALGLSCFLVGGFWPASSPAIENSECLECHSDQTLRRTGDFTIELSRMSKELYIDAEKFNLSVHHRQDVACIDCHADIEELDYDEEIPHRKKLRQVYCTTCHEEEGAAFVNSVHMAIRRKGITMQCYACHGYHYVNHLEAASVAERGNGFCLKCHNPDLSHDWLPQKKTHFAVIECTVCHAPEVARQINLNFYDLVANRFLSGREVLAGLNLDYDEFRPVLDANHDEIIDSSELDTLVFMLRQRNVRAVFHAELVSQLQPLVHQVSREGAERDCLKCHSPASPFFSVMAIILKKDDGTVDQHPVEPSVLAGYHVSHFSALAGTRVRLLDKIGIMMLLGGAAVVCGHWLVRLVTIPLRRKKETDLKLYNKEVSL